MPLYSYAYNLIAENIELFRFFYSMLIAFICLIVVIKTDRLFRISFHQGIRYFRNAFFFYGIAFILRYSLAYGSYFFLIKPFFQFFMIMAGFFLLYSLLWKKFETSKGSKSSFFNPIIFVFCMITLIIIFLDYLWVSYYFMFFSQILLFGLASIISCKNYKQNGKKHKFLKLYFIIMILSFFAWVFNFIFGSFFNWRLRWLANVYALNIIVFLVFLYGVIKLTKKQN
jgi:hypothetical protein